MTLGILILSAVPLLPTADPILPARPAAPLLPRLRPAAQEKGTVLIFGTDWCGWCKKMERTTLTDPRVVKALKNYTVTHVNGDNDPATVRKYRVTAYPTVVLLDAKNRVVKTTAGYMSPAEFLRWLE
jgi:thioredoxin-related protein